LAKGKRRPIGETIGGIIVGFDQQVFRSTPPAQELVKRGQPVRGLSGEDGGVLEVLFPDEGAMPDPAATTDDDTAREATDGEPRPRREEQREGPSGP
jgi:hypothetical protein